MKRKDKRQHPDYYPLYCPVCGWETSSWPGWVFIDYTQVKCAGHPGSIPRTMEAWKHPMCRKGEHNDENINVGE